MSGLEVLWLMVWGGMFTGIYNLVSPGIWASPLAFAQGVRALLPVLAAYLCLLWMMFARPRFPFARSPFRFFLLYIASSLVGSVFLSPDKVTALYWASVYLAPFLIIWLLAERDDPLPIMRRILGLNYGVMFVLSAVLLPVAARQGFVAIGRQETYLLPLGLGEVRANGVGRYALVVAIVAFVRLATGRRKAKLLWLLPLPFALYLLARTQSRTALLGLAVASILYVLLRGADWRFVFAGPVSAYVIWLSGFKWRAQSRWSGLLELSGREYTWQKGWAMVKQSPFFGWGFNADRILVNSEHMHNSYLHSAIHGGAFGALFFIAGLVGVWALILRRGLLRRIRGAAQVDRPFLMEAVMILGFLSARSLFESTAAFYGVDLLLFVSSAAYLWMWASLTAPTPGDRVAGAGGRG